MDAIGSGGSKDGIGHLHLYFTDLCLDDPECIVTAVRLIPGEELPLYSLVKRYYMAGRLNALLRWFSFATKIPSSTCFSHPMPSTHYIGEASYIYHTTMKMPLQIVILNYYRAPNIVCHLEPLVDSVKWQIYQKYYKPHLQRTAIIAKYEEDNLVGKLIQKQDFIRLMAELVVLSLITTRSERMQNYLMGVLGKSVEERNIVLTINECIDQSVFSKANLTVSQLQYS